MGSHSQAARMTTPAAVVFSLLASAAAQLCSTVQDPIKRDEGLGPWNVSRVERSGNGRNGRLVPVDNAHPLPHAFYEGDSYVLQYSVREGRKPDVIYFWQGSKSSVWEKGASAILTVDLDNKELRFIIYTFPVLNTAAAITAARFWQNRSKSFFSGLISLALLGHLFINLLASSTLLY